MRIPEHDLPLFPLNTVLFPRMALPLHVFEPRYQEMINRCIQEEIGFGVVLIKEGEEVGGQAIPYEVGTIARILDVKKQPDGQMNLVTMGAVRFRLLQTLDIHPYLSGEVERWEEEMGEVSALPRVTHVAQQVFVEYLNDLAQVSKIAVDHDKLTVPDDPQILSYAIAIGLQVPNEDKQTLLEMDTVEARLRHEIALIERERDYVKRLKSVRDFLPKKDEGGFSLN
ncbi:MAG: LON peptidase substrate-binding domain-containing protein [Anaerolineae bacterium]